jgi:hypothetical protein
MADELEVITTRRQMRLRIIVFACHMARADWRLICTVCQAHVGKSSMPKGTLAKQQADRSHARPSPTSIPAANHGMTSGSFADAFSRSLHLAQSHLTLDLKKVRHSVFYVPKIPTYLKIYLQLGKQAPETSSHIRCVTKIQLQLTTECLPII